MKQYIYVALLLILFTHCAENQPKQLESTNSQYTIKCFEVSPNNWGYDIIENNQVIIHQPHIPAIAGNKGFKTKGDANITASFMVGKLQKGIMPPTISINDLDSLGVLNP